jgi:hypothetical protein
MELTKVESSSHVTDVGYLATERVLLVRYRDGALYAWDDFGSVEWRSLMAPGQSIGAWLAEFGKTRKGIRIAKGGKASLASEQTDRGPATSGEAAGPLNVIDEEASRCCRKRLEIVFAGPVQGLQYWQCSACGTEFKPQAVGSVTYWRIRPAFAIARPRR